MLACTTSRSNLASYIGHGGDTYAFMSDNGYFPALNASISVIVNEDADGRRNAPHTPQTAPSSHTRSDTLKGGRQRIPNYSSSFLRSCPKVFTVDLELTPETGSRRTLPHAMSLG